MGTINKVAEANINKDRVNELAMIQPFAVEQLGDSLARVWVQKMVDNPGISISKSLSMLNKEPSEMQNEMGGLYHSYLKGDTTFTSSDFLQSYDPTFMTNNERGDYYKIQNSLLKDEVQAEKAQTDLDTEAGRLLAESLDNMEAVNKYSQKMEFDVFLPIQDLMIQNLDADTIEFTESMAALPKGPMTDPGEDYWWWWNLFGYEDIAPKYGESPEQAELEMEKQARITNPRGTDLLDKLSETNTRYIAAMNMLGTDLTAATQNPTSTRLALDNDRREIINTLKELSQTLDIPIRQKHLIIGGQVVFSDEYETPTQAGIRWYNEMVDNYQKALEQINLKFSQNAQNLMHNQEEPADTSGVGSQWLKYKVD